MKIKASVALLATGAALFLVGLFGEAEEVIVTALFVAGLSPFAYIVELRRRLAQPLGGENVEARLAELERRLSLTEGELSTANVELNQLKAEREFDRQLLGERVTDLKAPRP